MLTLLSQLPEVANTLQSRTLLVELEAEREAGVGGPQTEVGQAVDRGLSHGGIILLNLGAHG